MVGAAGDAPSRLAPSSRRETASAVHASGAAAEPPPDASHDNRLAAAAADPGVDATVRAVGLVRTGLATVGVAAAGAAAAAGVGTGVEVTSDVEWRSADGATTSAPTGFRRLSGRSAGATSGAVRTCGTSGVLICRLGCADAAAGLERGLRCGVDDDGAAPLRPRGRLVDGADDSLPEEAPVPVDPADPVVSANAIGRDPATEPMPSATANAPTRPT